MTITLTSTYSAVAPNITSSFLASGGTPPYVYTVLPNGAGGTINAETGLYTGPANYNDSASGGFDNIQVSDALSNQAQRSILVGSPVVLFCDIIQTYMGLANGRVYLWNQKIFQPTDDGIFIAVSIPSCKPFGNNTTYSLIDGVYYQNQYVNMYAPLYVDIISRGPAARDQKEMVILALGSNYAEQQMEANSFSIGKISRNFVDLSGIDGAAIPYRYQITCAIQYCVSNTTAIPYFDSFPGFTTTVNI